LPLIDGSRESQPALGKSNGRTATSQLWVLCGGAGFTASFIRVESYILVSHWCSVSLVFCTRVAVAEGWMDGWMDE